MRHDKIEIAGRELMFGAGMIAKQANGAVLARYGDTVVLVTAVVAREPLPGGDYLPLMVEYRERTYAAGKIPGGFFKREGRPRDKEVLNSRLIDRSIRPLFPDGFYYDVQVIATVLSVDQENDSGLLALNAASAALMISDITFNGPIGAVRIGRVDGQFVINPTLSQMKQSDLDLVVAGTMDSIVMIEGSASGLSEEEISKAMALAQENIKPIIELQGKMQAGVGKPKRKFKLVTHDPVLEKALRDRLSGGMENANAITDKLLRQEAIDKIKEETIKAYTEKADDQTDVNSLKSQIKGIIGNMEMEIVRKTILEKGIRPDGRGFEDIRPINCQVGVLPRTHGSALFTRGQTQALVAVTLGTEDDAQFMEELEGDWDKKYMLHYNFPPFSVGEVKMLRGVGRREIGHGFLAEKALRCIIPMENDFPYTIRIVSDILESNGSSSMATVCGASLCLMDAGIPIKAAVAGVSIGLIKEGDNVALLTDIQGVEDHYGDMDFKVAGTAEGVTAIQLDMKTNGISREILSQGLLHAKKARIRILEKMNISLSVPRSELSEFAPRIETIKINPGKIKDLIGPGGKMINKIIDETGVKIDVEDDGNVRISAVDAAAREKAIAMIREISQEAELGKLYTGKVKKIAAFGAFVEILPGVDGLIHISHLDEKRVARVEDVLHEGDEVMVKVIDITSDGKVRLSRKEALKKS